MTIEQAMSIFNLLTQTREARENDVCSVEEYREIRCTLDLKVSEVTRLFGSYATDFISHVERFIDGLPYHPEADPLAPEDIHQVLDSIYTCMHYRLL